MSFLPLQLNPTPVMLLAVGVSHLVLSLETVRLSSHWSA
jgi:hypothetical protein